MSATPEPRTYLPQDSVIFCKTDEPFGGLSNMAPGFPIVVSGVRFGTSEALYQCCRFPGAPEVQRLIIGERSPMTGKMKSKKFRHLSRPDWEEVRVRVMRWCLRAKLAQNWLKFGELLDRTGTRPIVEESRKDSFWGAKPTPEGTLVGSNVLGRLLMELRQELRSESRDKLRQTLPLDIPDFRLLGRQVGVVDGLSPKIPFIAAQMDLDEAPNRAEEHTVELYGDLRDKEWRDLIHFLNASGIAPQNAHVSLRMSIPTTPSGPSGTESKLRILAEMARRFGIKFRAS